MEVITSQISYRILWFYYEKVTQNLNKDYHPLYPNPSNKNELPSVVNMVFWLKSPNGFLAYGFLKRIFENFILHYFTLFKTLFTIHLSKSNWIAYLNYLPKINKYF